MIVIFRQIIEIIMMSSTNKDLVNERSNSNIDTEEMKKFLGVILYGSSENHSYLHETSVKKV